jgi:hypothetical protein
LSLVAIVSRDLLIGTRILDAAAKAGHDVTRVDAPRDLPEPSVVSIVFVDWAAREPDWSAQLGEWLALTPLLHRPQLVVFGPHTDLDAHREARAAGLGPMLARSKLISDLSTILRG